MSQTPEFLSIQDSYAEFRPAGDSTFNQAVGLIDEAIAYCKENEIRALLVDITRLIGIPPPTTIQRFEFATRWSATAGGQVTVALVSPPELIDPERIGVTMASNRGLRSEVFTDEAAALRWLQV